MNTQHCIYCLFLEQVKDNEDKIAIQNEKHALTYQYLLSSVEQYTSLLEERGCKTNEVVAIAIEPSIEFIIIVLACVKMGITYIPLNLDYPNSYLEEIIKDAQISTIITHKTNNFILDIDYIDISNLESNFKENHNVTTHICDPDNLVYIIYTSGTTGKPKGVCISNRNLASMITSMRQVVTISNNDKIPLYHSISFDFSIWEIYSSLLNGAKLIIPPKSVKNSLENYFDFIIQENITLANLTTSVLYYFIDKLLISPITETLSLKNIVFGGELLHPYKLLPWFNNNHLSEKVALYSLYGLTESTVISFSIKLTQPYVEFGKPILGSILNEHHKIVLNEIGEVVDVGTGELCIGGPTVSRGYYKQPILNNDRFFIHTDNTEEIRFFRTGDVVRILDNGSIEYLSRKDLIVKIKGFRVNLHEIEAALIQLEGIKNAKVSVYYVDETNPRLIAYLEGEAEHLNVETIKKYLKIILPDFMVPNRFIIVETFQINANGKIDTEYLKKLKISEKQENINLYSKTEKIVLKIWQEVIGDPEISDIDINFFNAGGDSILLPNLIFQLEEYFRKKITFINLIDYSTIRQFSKFIDTIEDNSKTIG